MTNDEREIIEQALGLPPKARAELAGRLIESLEEAVDENVEEAWASEVAKRVHELDTRKVDTVPWSQARRSIVGG
jgi:putative addiction module component (TIGR02574 family)